MDDYISRQAAIEALCEMAKRCQCDLGVSKIETHRAIDKIRNLPSASQFGWIPCSEWVASYVRNKHSAEFIVMLQGANRPTTLYLTKGGTWFDDSHEFYKNVISWMPLPEPYKPGEEE